MIMSAVNVPVGPAGSAHIVTKHVLLACTERAVLRRVFVTITAAVTL